MYTLASQSRRRSKLTTSASGFRSTPLSTTIMNAHGTPILKTLLEFSADFYGRDPEEMTAIHHVARSKTPDYALMLLEHNADIHAKSRDGQTPLVSAITYNNQQVLQCLLDCWYQYLSVSCLQGRGSTATSVIEFEKSLQLPC
jgi:hypothetical protein